MTRNGARFHAYHKFVKTTPKPRATKKRSGLLPPPLELLTSVCVAVADEALAVALAVPEDILGAIC